jgi:uncharacterized membrane protein YfcA
MTVWVDTWVRPPGCETDPRLYALVAAVVVLMIATSKGGFGGLAVAASPLFMTVADARTALGILLPLLLVCDCFTLPFYPKQFTWRPIRRLAPWTLAGIALGWLLLDQVTERTAPLLKVGVGALSVGFVGLEAVRWSVARRAARRTRGWRPGHLASAPFGLAAGTSTMLAHAAGAITTIYLLPQQLGPRVYVGTTARFYLIFNAVKIPFYVHLGLINRDTLQRSLWLVPIGGLGVWAGSELNKRFSARGFYAVMIVLLLLTGLTLIYREGSALQTAFGRS